MISSIGKVRYDMTSIVADIDDNIIQYYYSLIPKYTSPQRQMYKGHITIIRSWLETWPKSVTIFDGRAVEFHYEPLIQYSPPYFFLNVWSDDIGRIRQSLGLTYYRTGFDSYHITIGNTKDERWKTYRLGNSILNTSYSE